MREIAAETVAATAAFRTRYPGVSFRANARDLADSTSAPDIWEIPRRLRGSG
jgi:hypothetical protein